MKDRQLDRSMVSTTKHGRARKRAFFMYKENHERSSQNIVPRGNVSRLTAHSDGLAAPFMVSAMEEASERITNGSTLKIVGGMCLREKISARLIANAFKQTVEHQCHLVQRNASMQCVPSYPLVRPSPKIPLLRIQARSGRRARRCHGTGGIL